MGETRKIDRHKPSFGNVGRSEPVDNSGVNNASGQQSKELCVAGVCQGEKARMLRTLRINALQQHRHMPEMYDDVETAPNL